MTTSSSERGRCTRISPSAIIDDRLDGKDLEWALDHLKTCDACRDRIEEFREIVVRVERLSVAPIPPAVLRDAYNWAIPEGSRTDPELALGTVATAAAVAEAEPQPARFELPRWEPKPRDVVQDLRRSLMADQPASVISTPAPPPPAPPTPPAPPVPTLFPLEDVSVPVHEVAVESHRDWAPSGPQDAIPEDRAAPASDPEREARVATMTRVAVGVVAAACVLLAGFLYIDGGLLNPFHARQTSARTTTASASAKHSPTARPSPSHAASIAPSATPAPTVPVVASVGDGVAGDQVFRIRLGTSDPRFTRLVFDMNGQGLPTMTVTQPDAQHLVVTFKNTTGAGTATAGIHTARVAAVEPAVQQGSDLVFTIDLARAVQPQVSTRVPSDGPPSTYRLVLDLY